MDADADLLRSRCRVLVVDVSPPVISLVLDFVRSFRLDVLALRSLVVEEDDLVVPSVVVTLLLEVDSFLLFERPRDFLGVPSRLSSPSFLEEDDLDLDDEDDDDFNPFADDDRPRLLLLLLLVLLLLLFFFFSPLLLLVPDDEDVPFFDVDDLPRLLVDGFLFSSFLESADRSSSLFNSISPITPTPSSPSPSPSPVSPPFAPSPSSPSPSLGCS